MLFEIKRPGRARASLGLTALAIAAMLLCPRATQAQDFAPGDVTFVTPPDPVFVFDVWEAVIQVRQPAPGNPFAAGRIRGTFVAGTSGATTSIEGFCDSQDGSLYRLRFAPREAGPYSFALHFDDGLRQADTQGTLIAVPGDNPGFLRVDPAHPHHFIYEGTGRHFYLLGHTAYHIANPAVPEANWVSYLDHIASLGFNKVRMLISSGRARAFWHYRIFPWTGDLDTSTFDQYDVSLWQHFEQVIRAMADRGIVADVVFEVDKEDFAERFSSFDVPSDREKAFYRYAANRFGAFTNVVWNLGNEYIEYHSQAWARAIGTYLKSVDPYDHLTTAHGYSAFPFGHDAWADTACLQAYPSGSATRSGENWLAILWQIDAAYHNAKPVVDDEYGYEVPYSPASVRKTHWSIATSGGYGSYGSYESLSVTTTEQRLWSYEVADAAVAKIKTFFEKTDYWLLESDPAVIRDADSPALCLSNRGSEYVVYLPEGGTVTLDLAEAAGLDLPLEWVDPLTLAATPADPPSTGGAPSIRLTAPAGNADMILHVGKLVRDQDYFADFEDGRADDWASQGGTWAVTDGVFRQTNERQSGDCVSLIGRTFSNFTLDVDVRVADGSARWAGVSLRKNDPHDCYWTSGYLVLLRNDRSVELLQPTPDHPFTLIARTIAPSLVPGAWNRLTVTAGSGSIVVQINHQTAFGYTIEDPIYRSGYVSLAGEGSVIEFDNVRVRPVYFEDWNDSVSDGLQKLRGPWRESNLALEKTGNDRPALVAVDFPPLYEFTTSVEVTIPDAGSSEFAGVLLSQGKIEWPFSAPAFAVAVTNRGPSSAPAVALVRVDASGRRVLGYFEDDSGNYLRVGEKNRIGVSIAGGRLSVTVNGEVLVSYLNRGGSYGALSVGLLCGATEASFDNLLVRDDQLAE